MGLGHVNVWVVDDLCIPLTGVWKLDLSIRTCSHVPLIDFFPDVVSQISGQYPSATVSVDSVTRNIIIMYPMSTGYPSINHVHIDIPPGCYVAKARVCYTGNENTSEVCFMVNCDDMACLKLKLPEVMHCGEAFIFPAMIEGIKLNYDREHMKGFININANIINKDVYAVKQMVQGEQAVIVGKGLSDLETYVGELIVLLDEMINS